MTAQSQFKCSNFPTEIRTSRLLLRHWNPADRSANAALNADARVMHHYPGVMSTQESNALADRIENHFATYGFGLFAVEIPEQISFCGFVGLIVPRFDAHFTPCVELGWRLNADYWGHGYATEAARAVVARAFENLAIDQLVAMTVPGNDRSQRVMIKLGMTRNPDDDFDHPLLPNSRLSRHVLYRLPRAPA